MNAYDYVSYLHAKVRFGDARQDMRWEAFSPVFARACEGASLIVDAGAEYGFYIHLARRANPSCRVIAFEPEPPRYDALQRFFAEAEGVDIRPQALMDRRGEVRIYKAEGRSASVDPRLSQWQVDEKQEISVPAIALDDALQGAVPDVIKMDIEGAEVFALDGMTRTLATGRPVVFLEFHGKFIEAMRPGGSQSMRDRLESLGYGIYDHMGRVADFSASRVILATAERARSLAFDAPRASPGAARELAFSRDFSLWYNAVQTLRARGLRVVLYGHGSVGRVVRALIPECVVATLDRDAGADGSKQDPAVLAPSALPRLEYDFVVICVLGREDAIMAELTTRYGVPAERIMRFRIGDPASPVALAAANPASRA